VRFVATTGSAAVEEAVVVVELERRVFCWTLMSLVRKAVTPSESPSGNPSGIVSGATFAAEKVAWFEGRRVRKWCVGWMDILVWVELGWFGGL
jgi:hypothetical protein